MALKTPSEAAAQLREISPRTLERWRSEGKGPAFVKLGRRVAYTDEALEEFVRRNTRTSTAQAERKRVWRLCRTGTRGRFRTRGAGALQIGIRTARRRDTGATTAYASTDGVHDRRCRCRLYALARRGVRPRGAARRTCHGGGGTARRRSSLAAAPIRFRSSEDRNRVTTGRRRRDRDVHDQLRRRVTVGDGTAGAHEGRDRRPAPTAW